MHTDLTQGGSAGGPPTTPPQDPDFGLILKSTLDLYGSARQFAEARCAIREVEDLLRRDRDGRLTITLPADRAERFKLHCRAHEALDWIPSDRLIQAHAEVKLALKTKPSVPERQWLVGQLLNIFGISAGDDRRAWVQHCAFELGNLHEPSDIDRNVRFPPFIPSPAIVHMIRRIVMKPRGESYGRPPPIWEIVDMARESRVDLHDVLREISRIGRDWQALKSIVNATDDSYPPTDETGF
jgi:hypothetical protein